MKLQGKTAVVTGASIGIGRKIAEAIAANGGRVALVARSMEGLKKTNDLIQTAGGKAQFFPTDLRSEAEINKLVLDVRKIFGDIDFLVNVAGVWHNDTIAYAGVPLVQTPAEQINEVLDVGIRAPMLITRLFLPGMIAKKGGKILSISGTFASGGAGWLHYYVSKLALEHFTVGLSQELREHEIQVNCISPSDTDTESLRKFFPDDAKTALDPNEIAKLAIYLLSDESSHITGQCIVIKNKAVY
jgi:NAD(P)-dependent dehydrogenase (short-subunit alcohol dehydrogenase family)